MAETKIRCEVWRSSNGTVTVCTDREDGGGTRLCGVKLTGSRSVKIAEFWLDRNSVDSLSEDLAAMEEKTDG